MPELVLQGQQVSSVLQNCIAGSRSSQKLLYDYFAPRMFAICLRYAKDYHNAEDILQDGFVKVFNHIDRFRGEGSFEGWMKRIFINTAIEHYRKAQNHSGHSDIDTVQAEPIASKAGGLLARQDLMKLVQSLPVGYRTIFNLYAIEGYTHREIGEMLSISEGTSKSQLARARTTLQRMLAEL